MACDGLRGPAQLRPYIGYVYPAGGQQGTTFQVRLGGQGLDDVRAVVVSGAGLPAGWSSTDRRLNNQEIQLLREQLQRVERGGSRRGAARRRPRRQRGEVCRLVGRERERLKLIAEIDKRIAESCTAPACPSIANIVLVEVTVAPDASPGPRRSGW